MGLARAKGLAGRDLIYEPGLVPAADVLSCRDEKGRKEALPYSAPRSGVPSLGACLRRFAQDTSLCPVRTPGSLLGRFALALCLRVSLGLSKGARTTHVSRLSIHDVHGWTSAGGYRLPAYRRTRMSLCIAGGRTMYRDVQVS
jgi:hypothetical protein